MLLKYVDTKTGHIQHKLQDQINISHEKKSRCMNCNRPQLWTTLATN